MSGMPYKEAVRLLNSLLQSKDLGASVSDDMWKAIITAVTDDSAIYDPMLDPEFSLDEMDAAQKVIDGLNRR